MQRTLWVFALGVLVGCGATRKNPPSPEEAGSSGASGGGAESGAGGGSDGGAAGSQATAGAGGEGGVAEDPLPVSVSPLSPEDDVKASIACLAPSPIEHWQFPSDPRPRSVLAIDPKSSTTFYGQLTSAVPSGTASVFSAWLLRTDDGGASWCQLDLPEAIHDLVVSPAERSVLYAAGTTHYYRSDDFGNRWQKTAAVGQGRLVAHETEVNTLYEVGDITRRSVDGGYSWEAAGGSEPVQELAFAEDGSPLIYGVSAPCSLRRSSDWGQTWKRFRIADSCEKGPPSRLKVSSGVLYLTEWSGGNTIVHHSTDNGEHWARTDALTLEAAQPLTFRGDEPGVLYLSDGDAIQRSTDYGQTWSEHLTVPDGGRVSTLGPRTGVFHAEESRDLSLLSLDDGESWVTTAVVRDGTVHTTRANPDYVYIAGAHWLYRSTDGGKTFASLAWPNEGESRRLVVAQHNERLLAMSVGSRWLLSTNGGDTWPPWTPTIDGVKGPALFESLTPDPIWESTWYATRPGEPALSSGTAGGWFNSMKNSGPAREVVPASTDWVVYALAGDLDAPELERSDDRGTSWSRVCRPPTSCPTSLQVHRTSALHVIGVGTEEIDGARLPVLMSSADGGLIWARQAIDAGAPWRTFYGSNQHASAWSLLDHAYRSGDLGATWSRFSVPVTGEVDRDYSASEAMFVNNAGIWRFQP